MGSRINGERCDSGEGDEGPATRVKEWMDCRELHDFISEDGFNMALNNFPLWVVSFKLERSRCEGDEPRIRELGPDVGVRPLSDRVTGCDH